MLITNLRISNFRQLKGVNVSINNTATLIVGRNNTGKTSLTEIFRGFFQGKKLFRFEDFSISSMQKFKDAFIEFETNGDNAEARRLLPVIELIINSNYKDNESAYGALSDFILDLDPDQYEAEIHLQYQLADGKMAALFEDINEETEDAEFFRLIKARVALLYETKVLAVDPNDHQNQVEMEFRKLNQILKVDFINAQRGLNDETHAPNDVLGKTLGNIFKSASQGNAPAEFRAKSEEINVVIQGLQRTIDSEFKTKVEKLFPTIASFGYPGLHDPQLTATTSLDAKSILQTSTQVQYKKNGYVTLPETYNGLGSRNLIFMLLQLYDFFRNYQSEAPSPKAHLVFIEEPEAHLHPQMQEVFIRQLSEIKKIFESTFNENKPWPVQFIVSTHSTHIANEADFDAVRYFVLKQEFETEIKDLSKVFCSESDAVDKEFLHKYLTLTKCDLYFADKAILVEGATERILLPQIIKRFDATNNRTLRSNYLSVVEIGGAFAHHFFKFLDFLELKTLIITDLDCSIKNTDGRTTYPKCERHLATHSTNTGLKNWFSITEEGYAEIGAITSKTEVEKTLGFRHIAYQIPESGKLATGRSFEDAFILANPSIFAMPTGILDNEAEKYAFEKAEKIASDSKADFAIKYATATDAWVVPKYIDVGLLWLSEDLQIQINDEVGE